MVSSILERVDPSPFGMDPEKYTQCEPFSYYNEASERVPYVAEANDITPSTVCGKYYAETAFIATVLIAIRSMSVFCSSVLFA
jgi:hypothetical protein